MTAFYLTMKEDGKDVRRARGNPKPTKYGQLDSMYDRRFGAFQPEKMKKNKRKIRLLLTSFVFAPTLRSVFI